MFVGLEQGEFNASDPNAFRAQERCGLPAPWRDALPDDDEALILVERHHIRRVQYEIRPVMFGQAEQVNPSSQVGRHLASDEQ